MIFQYLPYKETDWLELECGFINFYVEHIYIYEQPLARNLIATFNLKNIYKFVIKEN